MQLVENRKNAKSISETKNWFFQNLEYIKNKFFLKAIDGVWFFSSMRQSILKIYSSFYYEHSIRNQIKLSKPTQDMECVNRPINYRWG